MDRLIENLFIWNESRIFVNAIYKMMANCKDWGFRDQIQRASVSIMNNIAEGSESGSDAKFVNFLNIAKGSCGEVRSQLYRALDAEFISQAKFDELFNMNMKLSASIAKFIVSLKSSTISGQKNKSPET